MSASNETQKGFTLLEMLMVIGVSVILVGAGVGMWSYISANNKKEAALRLVESLVVETSAYKAVNNSFAGLDCNVWESVSSDCALVKNNILMARQSNPYGGKITIGSVDAGSKIRIVFSNLTRSACTRMITSLGQRNNIRKIEVFEGNQDVIMTRSSTWTTEDTPSEESFAPPGGGGGATEFTVNSTTSFPTAPAQAASLCDGDVVTIAWMFD